MLQKFIILVVLTSLSSFAFAQTGAISGVITDSKTSETIIGANVSIQGTQIGAATDIDGKFLIQNVKPGTYNLVISFITYKTHIIPDVVVEANKKTDIAVAMVEDAQQLEEVVVTGTRQIDTDFALMRAIRESKLVVSGISAEQISKSQDRDAAQVVRRVPGVTLQDNRFIVVRGLSSRYNSTILNGVLAPSTETDSRAFSFDIIPSSLLDRMLIYKSGAAELPGDFAGAVVQVYTKSAVESKFTNFSISGGYRQGTTFTTQQSQNRASTEWLGFDNGFRSLPSGAPSDYGNLAFDPAAAEAASRKFENSWGLEQINVKPDLRFNFDLGRNFEIGKVEVSTVNSLSYSNTSQYNEREFNRYFAYTQTADGNDLTSDELFTFKDDQFTNNVRIGLLSNWSFKYSPTSRIEFKNLVNRLGSNQTIIREGLNNLRDTYYRNYSFRYIGRTIYSSQIEGKHELSDASKLTWLVGYNSASRQEPDWKRLSTGRDPNATEGTPFKVDVPYSASQSSAARFYQDFSEYSITQRLDYEHKFLGNPEKDPYELKAGYWLEYKDRSFQSRNIGHTRKDGFDPSIESLPFDQIFSSDNVDYNSGHIISENTRGVDSYTATNMLAAGYVSMNMPVSEKFRIIPGVRVEYNKQELQSAPGFDQTRVNLPVTSTLPFLNVAYNLSTSSLLRVAYSKTVNRPEFREIAPFTFYDFENQADVIGNPDLNIANIHNVDFRWEYYPTPAEFVSVGTFYKYFNDPIEATIRSGSDNPVFFFTNADNATNYGVEVEVRKALAYSSASQFLNKTFVVFNAAYIHSVIEFDQNGIFEGKSKRPMQGQSPYIINAALFYQDDEAGLQANLQYNIFGKRIALVGVEGNPTWWEMPRNSLDFTFSKRISNKADIRFGISDILNARQYIREDANLDNNVENAETNRVVKSTRSGQYFTLGVAFKF